MHRWFFLCCSAAALWCLGADTVFAQAADSSGWPPNSGTFTRDPGFNFSPWKIAAYFLLFVHWVSTADWVSQDCLNRKFNYGLWNPLVVFPFIAATLLVFLIPMFAVGISVMVVAYAGPVIAYVVYRNGQVQWEEKVFTAMHLRRWFSDRLAMIGIKVAREKLSADEVGPDVKFLAQGGETDRDDNVNLLTARQSLGYQLARELVFDALSHRADGVRMDVGNEAIAVSYQIDGVWHGNTSQERATGDTILAVFKTLAALKPDERRARQSGAFGMKSEGKQYKCSVASQGTKTGETAVVQMADLGMPFQSLEALGLRAKMAEQLAELMDQESGMIVFSALPAGGLTTTLDGVLDSLDRYMRNFAAVEDDRYHDRDLENVPVTKYQGAKGETPATVLEKLIRTYPDVIIVRDMVNAQAATTLCGQADGERMIITSTRAKDASEALLRILMLKVPPAKFAKAVTAVLNQRLIRKLCDACKEPYPPTPELLKQLGLPAGRIEKLYRPPTEADPDKPCPECLGIGYHGRTAVYELLRVNDAMREIIAKSPKLDLLRAAARKAKHRTIKEEGILLVAKGVTSLAELQRVLKQ